MVNAKRSCGNACFLPQALGVDIFQETVELWVAQKAFPRQRNIGIQNQRVRVGEVALAAFATRLMLCPASAGNGESVRPLR
jgi:hypothetical protein